jgi:hypothetical protein
MIRLRLLAARRQQASAIRRVTGHPEVPKPCHVLFHSVAGGALRNLPSGCDAQSLDELLHRFVHNGIWLDPTIQSFRYWAPTQWSTIFSGFRELVPPIRKNHVSILAGTDSSGVLEEKGHPPGTSLHDELALLVDAGFTPLEALRAATWTRLSSLVFPTRWEPSRLEKPQAWFFWRLILCRTYAIPGVSSL